MYFRLFTYFKEMILGTYSLYGCPFQCLLYELSDFILSTGGGLDGRMNIGSTLPQCLNCVSICFYLNELRTDY